METYKNEIKDAQNHIEHFKFDKQDPWHRNLIALYLLLIEYSDALIYLVENEKSIAVPVVFRSLLEAYVDFKNLSEDQTYGYYMEISNAKEWLKFFEEASKNQNAYLALTASEPNLTTAIQEQNAILAELKAKGYQPLSVSDKFKRAGMIEEYKSIYNYLCIHSHNNINSFTERFFVFNDAKNDFEITLFKEQEDDEFDRYLSTGCACLRNGSHNIHAVLETGYENKFPV
jgi:hypothetical protein